MLSYERDIHIECEKAERVPLDYQTE